MKKTLLNKKVVNFFLTTSVFTIMSSPAVYADQVGSPATSIIVNQQSSATDSDNCGITSTSACKTIQYAVNRIATGGTITVSSGIYYENILVNKVNITIASAEGKASTIIDGGRTTNETVSEAMRIIADGVKIGLVHSTPNGFTPDNNNNGFTFRNSIASGLFSIGNNVTISGNTATTNGARGFQFGLSTVDDNIDVSSKNIVDDPLNGATVALTFADLQTQSNVIVHNNLSHFNAIGGFSFAAFDDSRVYDNSSVNNEGAPAFLGQGSGFWIDSDSNRVTLERNKANSNTGDGIFYRRGGGAFGGLVSDQIAIGNTAGSNGRHGIIFMGDNILAQDNIVMHNQSDGLHFMGFDNILDVSNNHITNNSGAGIGFRDIFSSPSFVLLNFDANGQPIQPGGIHNNHFRNNQSHSFPDTAELENQNRCGIASTLVDGSIVEISNNNFGDDQKICDATGNSVFQR